MKRLPSRLTRELSFELCELVGDMLDDGREVSAEVVAGGLGLAGFDPGEAERWGQAVFEATEGMDT